MIFRSVVSNAILAIRFATTAIPRRDLRQTVPFERPEAQGYHYIRPSPQEHHVVPMNAPLVSNNSAAHGQLRMVHF
jgi:hypothetical protein